MADIFLSYSKLDRTLAEAVVADLEGAGFTVWWDDRLNPIGSWDRHIEEEIDDARCVLVLWTKHSVDTEWVRIEANFAKENRKLVQARFDDIRVPLGFTMNQYLDLERSAVGKQHAAWQKLLEWLASASGVEISKSPKPQGSSSNIPYWEAFHAIAESRGVRRPLLSPVKGTNYYLYLSKKPEVCVTSYISRAKGGSMSAYVAMWYDPAKSIFEALKEDKVAIEKEVGEPLLWTQQAATTFWISFEPLTGDPDNRADWSRQHNVLADRMAKLKLAISKRLPRIVEGLKLS
jgi:hypothetical protein